MRRCSSLALVACVIPAAASAQQQELERCPSLNVSSSASLPETVIVVTLFGNVLARPAMITEEDRVLVRIPAVDAMAQLVTVHRTSPARTVGDIRIIGAQDPAFTSQALDESKTATLTPTCFIDAVLDDFAPGLGQAEIRLVTAVGSELKRVTVAAFDFNVEPVFAGMISLGPIVSDLQDPQFTKATNAAAETYISESESGDDRILYALIYTPFVAGKRVAEPPLTRDPRSWLRRINPMFGVILNDIGKNAVGGVSVDLPFGIIAHAGWHVGRTSEIDDQSGLSAGSVIAADATIPVVRRWNIDRFWGLTLDTRVALRLLGLASRTSAPQ
jgi:hypothetical protein